MKKIIIFAIIIVIAAIAIVLVLNRPALAPSTISDQFEIREKDNHKAFTYTLTSRFLVILDENKYPETELACSPIGIIGKVSNTPAVEPPNYAANFEAVTAGTCQLTSRGFSVTIIVTNQ